MAVRAYILIEAAVGGSNEVLTALRELSETVQADRVTGPYDLICVLELEDLNALGALVREKIHPIAGIKRTMSCIGIPSVGK